MASTIKLKNGSGAPTSGQLVQGEPAFDLTNKRLYTENASGTVIEVGTNPSSLTTASADINGGTIDGTVIGGSSAAAGTFTSITGTSANINGTVTADGLTVDLADNAGVLLQSPNDSSTAFLNFGDSTSSNSGSISYDHFSDAMRFKTVNTERLRLASNGDLLLYEDTGTTAKFFWDASAESLGIGTSSPSGKLTISEAAGFNAPTTVTAANTYLQLGSADYATNGKFMIGFGYTDGATNTHSPAYMGFDMTSSSGDTKGDLTFFTRDVTTDTAPTERMRITSSGQLLIGTTSSSEEGAFVATSSGGETAFSFRNNATAANTASSIFLQTWTNDNTQAGASKISSIKDGTTYGSQLAFYTTTGTLGNTTEAMRIDSSGNVGIGGSPVAGLHIQTSTRSLSLAPSATGGGGASYILMGNSDSSGVTGPNVIASGNRNLQFGVGDDFSSATGGTFSEYMRIDSSGNLLVGRTSVGTTGTGHSIRGGDSVVFAREGGEVLIIARNTNNGEAVRFDCQGTNGVGSIDVTTTATTYNTSSDQRLKDNIVDAPSASNDIDAIQVRSFDWKADGSHQKYGMVAQELMTVAPEAISGDPDSDEMMGVDYSKLVPMLIKEIQSLRARVAQLEGAN